MAEKVIASVPDMIFMVDNQFNIQKIYNADPVETFFTGGGIDW